MALKSNNILKYKTYMWNNNRYHGCHKDREERQTFKYPGKISHL
jgi:hypothetical protein